MDTKASISSSPAASPGESAWRPRQHSTLLKVTDAYYNEDFLDMHLRSVRKLTAHSIEAGKIAKRVNMVHRKSETNSMDGTHGYGITGNITDRTMDLVKLLSTLDKFKSRNSLNAPEPEMSHSEQASEVVGEDEPGSEEDPEEGEQLAPPSGLSDRGGAEELLQRPWQLRLLQMEQQFQRMQQQQQQQQQLAEGQGLAPDAPWSLHAQGDAEGQSEHTQKGCPAALQSFSPYPSPSPSTTDLQHLCPKALPELGEGAYGLEGTKGPRSKLPATVHSLRLLSSPDARQLVASMAAARKKPNALTSESLHRAQKLPHYPPPARAHLPSRSPTDPHPHQKVHTGGALFEGVWQQEGHRPMHQQAAASGADQGGMARPLEHTCSTPFSNKAGDAAGGNPQGSAGDTKPGAPPGQDGEASGVLLGPPAAFPIPPQQQQHQHQQEQQKQQVPCLMPSPGTETPSIEAENAASQAEAATAAAAAAAPSQTTAAALPGSEKEALPAASPEGETAALPGSEMETSPEAEVVVASPQIQTAALPGSETTASPQVEAAAAGAAEDDTSRASTPSPVDAPREDTSRATTPSPVDAPREDTSPAITPSPANASKRATPSNIPDVANSDGGASRRSSRKGKTRSASGKSKGSSRSMSPGKKSKSMRIGRKSSRKGSKSPSKRSSSTPKSKKKRASGRPSSRPASTRPASTSQEQNTSGASSSHPPASAGVQKGASGTTDVASKSARGLDGVEIDEAQGRQLQGVLKPMEREVIGASISDLEDPGRLGSKHEVARLQGLHLQAFARRNPAGFDENEAAYEVAAYSEAAQRGRHVLSIAQNLPGDKEGEKALWSAMQELHFRRPFLVMPELPSSSSRAAAVQSAAWQLEHQEYDLGQADLPPLSRGARLQARLRAHEVAASRRASWAAATESMHSGSMGGALHGSGHDAWPSVAEHQHQADSAPQENPSPHTITGSPLFSGQGGMAHPHIADPGSPAGAGSRAQAGAGARASVSAGGRAQAGSQEVGVPQGRPGSGGGQKAKADGHKADEHKADEHKADGHEADEHKADEHKANGHEADEHKADEHKADGHEADEHKADGHKADGQKADGKKADSGNRANMVREQGQARRSGQHIGGSSKGRKGAPSTSSVSTAAGPRNAKGETRSGVDEGGNAELSSAPQTPPKQPPAKEAERDTTNGSQQQQQQQQQQQHQQQQQYQQPPQQQQLPGSAFGSAEGKQPHQHQHHVNLQLPDSSPKAGAPSKLPLHASPHTSFGRGGASGQDSSLLGTSGGPMRSRELQKSGMLGSLSRHGRGQRDTRRSSSVLGSKRRASSVTPLEEEDEEEESPPGWNAQEHSLFAPRAKSSDSHDVLDSRECRQKQLDLDWQRLVSRHPFRYFMSKEAHPPPLIELPPSPEEDLEAGEPSFTFQRLMALHAASKADTSHPSEDIPPHTMHHTTTTASAIQLLRTSPHPNAQPRTKTGASDTFLSSNPEPHSTPSPPPPHTPVHARTRSPQGSSPHRGTSSPPLPEIGASGSHASLRRAGLAQQQQGEPPVGSAGSVPRVRAKSPGQRQAAAPKLPKLPTAAERAQQAVQQKPALAWHTESWLQLQEQAPEWTPGQTLPRMQAVTRQQKRTSVAPPSPLLPPVVAQPLDEASPSQEQQKRAEELEQALTPLQKVLAQRHPLLLAIFGSYALVVSPRHGGPDPGLMLPYSAWVVLLEDCRVIDTKRPGSKDEEFLGAFNASCSGKYPLSPQAPPSDMLMRFEYFEALIRVAVAKYVKTGQHREVHAALSTLINEHLQGHLPAAMRQDPNAFRANLLYTPSIDATLQQAAPMLRALHASACGARRTTFLKLDGWIELLQSCNVIGFHVGVSIPDAASIFSSSQLLVVDELKHYWRVCGLDFLDFMEAICRVATLLDPPARPELQRRLRECLGVTPEHILTTMAGHPYYTYYQKLALQPRDFKFSITEGPDASTQASDERHQVQRQQQQRPEQPQQEQQGNHRQQSPVLALRHKLRALLDLIQGSQEAISKNATKPS